MHIQCKFANLKFKSGNRTKQQLRVNTQNTHLTYFFFYFFLQKPYKCEVLGCTKRYTDPSSLRKHVKSHTLEEQEQYRKAKDQANLAKRAGSPALSTTSSRFSSPSRNWASGAAAGMGNLPDSPSWHHPATSATSVTSTSTLLGLQAGGTIVNMEQRPQPSQQNPAGFPAGSGLLTGHQQQYNNERKGEKTRSWNGKVDFV